ncbi:MAG: S41 family peptidase [Solobacterium sp.]|nr:S41 family peptidase [Solobacterium sp.]
MSEENKNDELHRIKLTRHLWPDELALKNAQKKVSRLRITLITSVIAALILGWLGGSVLPLPGTSGWRSGAKSVIPLNSAKKVESLLKVMEEDWFFGKDIENLDVRLTDQALYGITKNEEDPHTSYMSAQEVEDFVQGINRNFVGIGVEFMSAEGVSIVQKVFKNTPADKAGVQAGDIFSKVDGKDVTGLSSDELKELVIGEEGTDVTIEFMRQGQPVTLKITRGQVSATAYGYILDDGIGYLELYQFGEGTPKEVSNYLEDFVAHKVTKLIIDLRDNGGGYLDALEKIAARFLSSGTVIMKQEYRNGVIEETKASGNSQVPIDGIVILVNDYTASASEVLTLALKEQRSDVTIVGQKTYGKGTVQITRMFSDDSAVKYTTSKWLSPSGTWINGTGITPDIEVSTHPVLDTSWAGMEDDETYSTDTVSELVRNSQLALDYLDYKIDRTDGYFSEKTAEVLKQFQQEHKLTADGILNTKTYEALYSAVTLDWNTSHTHDTQLAKAREVLNGK